MTTGRRARGARPFLPGERRGLLRNELISHYDADAEFRAALKDLAERKPADGFLEFNDDIAFDEEIVALAERFGLQRLRGDDGVNVSGVELLCRWFRIGSGGLARAASFGFYPPDLAGNAPRRYDLSLESRQAYDERIREYADRVEREGALAGYLFPDTAPQLLKQVRWLFLRLRHGWTFPAIAEAEAARPDSDPDEPKSDAAIRLAVGRLAVDIGADV